MCSRHDFLPGLYTSLHNGYIILRRASQVPKANSSSRECGLGAASNAAHLANVTMASCLRNDAASCVPLHMDSCDLSNCFYRTSPLLVSSYTTARICDSSTGPRGSYYGR